MPKKFGQLALSLVLLLLFVSPVNAKPDEATVPLTEVERAWIKDHPTIKVGNETDWPPFDYVRDGKPYGFSIDMIQKVGDLVGLKIDFVNGFLWSELVSQFAEGTIDVLPALYFTPERGKTMVFTEGYAVNPASLVVHKDRSELNSLEDFDGLKLAVLPETSFDQLIKKRYPAIKRVPVEGALDGMLAVSFGKADGFVESLSVVAVLLEENLLSNLKVVSAQDLHQGEENKLRMAVKNRDAVLRGILEKGLNAIDHGTRNKLFETHFAANRRLFQIDKPDAAKISFTDNEKKWLKNNPVVTFSEVNWKPMSIVENGQMVGVMGDYLALIAQETGLRFEFVSANSWPDVLKKFADKTIDMVPGVATIR